MAEAQNNNKSLREVLRERKHVQEVCSDWKLYEDSAYAHEIQQEEYQYHFDSNRQQRRVIRDDLALAKELQQKEDAIRREKQANAEYENEATLSRLLESQRLCADQEELIVQDEEYARRLQEKYEKRLEERKRRWEEKKRQKLLEKQREALQSADSAPTSESTTDNAGEEDEELARRLQAEEVARAREEQARLEEEIRARHSSEQEMLDAHVARLLHQREKEKLRRLQEQQQQRRLKKQAEANSSNIQAPTLPSKSGMSNPSSLDTGLSSQNKPADSSLPPPSFPAPKLDALTSRMVAQNQQIRESTQASSSASSSQNSSSNLVTVPISNSLHPTPSMIEAHPQGPLSSRPEHTYQNLDSLSSRRSRNSNRECSASSGNSMSAPKIKENLDGLSRHISAGDPLHKIPMNYKRSNRN